MSEISIVNARANVMVYDEQQKKWLPSGNSPGMAKVQVYHHTVNNTYRVVGRKINDHTVVINCALSKGLRYHVATERFHQWRDQRQVYGLNFASSAEADEFGTMVQNCLTSLAGGASPQQDIAVELQKQQEDDKVRQEEERIENERIEADKKAEEESREAEIQEAERLAEEERKRIEQEERQLHMAPAPPLVPPPAAPAAPKAPAAPPAPKAPIAPPAPAAPRAPAAPPAPGAPPAPRAPGAPPAPRAPGAPGAPPAPKPVVSSGGGVGMDLASQIANAKLKSSAGAARPAPKPALSLQDEMRLKLERRKAKAEGQGGDVVVSSTPVSNNIPNNTDNAPASPSQKPKWKQDLENRNNASLPASTRAKPVSKMNGADDASIVEAIEKMKQDLLAAFKTEISSLKDEIQELKEQVNSQR